MASEAEVAAMRRAVEISAAARGTSNPNPTVGAVVIDATGSVVGEGVTQAVGGDHAEVVALRAAGAAASGATVVVTLEPCCHTGRTSRCTDAIRSAGVARVVFAIDDPHDVAAGGAALLRDAGIEVEAGVLDAEAATVLGPWVTSMARSRPHVTWKYAATLDGRTAAADGSSQWITGPEARRDVHRERLYADAVIVGIGTVLADDPSLTVRDWPAPRQPLRVVVDSDGRTPLTARVLDRSAATVVAVSDGAPEDKLSQLRGAGADVVRLPRTEQGLDPIALLAALWEREAALVLLEGGTRLATAFARCGLIDRLLGYYAPMLLGSGHGLVGDLGITSLGGAGRFSLEDVSRIGDDIRVVARISAGSE